MFPGSGARSVNIVVGHSSNLLRLKIIYGLLDTVNSEKHNL